MRHGHVCHGVRMFQVLLMGVVVWGVSQPRVDGSTNRLAMVFGSSVALGLHGEGGFINGSYVNGYAGRLTLLMPSLSWSVTNTSIAGNATADALARFNTDVVPSSPEVVLIGLSLANEGLLTSSDPAGTCERFRTNMLAIVQKCRDNGFYPVVGLVYPNSGYTTTQYNYLKTMNLTLNDWNVPTINFLGALDDGSGHWVNGYFFDGWHPNALGYQEMFFAIVPSLFNAVHAGMTNSPDLAGVTNCVRILRDPSWLSPVVFTPSNRLHSYTVSFRLRTTGTGTVAVVRPFYEDASPVPSNSVGSIEVTSNALVYVSTSGQVLSAPVSVTNGHWYDVALAHRYAHQETLFFVDGVAVGSVAEQMIPDRFVLGGSDGATNRAGSPTFADYQNWCVYRAAWNAGEAFAQHEGRFQKASLEVCSPLADPLWTQGMVPSNRAQSLSLALVNAGNLSSVGAGLAATGMIAQAMDSSIALSWSLTSPTATGYQLERRRAGMGTYWSPVTNRAAGASACDDPSATAGVAYEYRVCSVEGNVYGMYSGIASATVQNALSANLTLNPAAGVCSSIESPNVAANAFDGDSATRWGSSFADNQWIYIDLGTDYVLSATTLDWETAHSRDYTLRMRTGAQGVDSPVNPANWTQVAAVIGRSGVNGTGGSVDDMFSFSNGTFTAVSGSFSNATVSANPSGRYLMIYGTTRVTAYGHSLFEVTVGGRMTNSAGSSAATPASGCVLIDFGPTNIADGAAVANPDRNGNTWNSWLVRSQNSGATVPNGAQLSALITTANVPTVIGVQVTSGGWVANGIANGGLLSPDAAYLGILAITNATQDYFYTTQVDPGFDKFLITGLETNAIYKLSLFASRSQTGPADVRGTRYSIIGANGTNVVDLQTTGLGIGAGGYSGNNSNIVSVSGVKAMSNRTVEVHVSSTQGGYGYIGILKLEWRSAPSRGTILICR